MEFKNIDEIYAYRKKGSARLLTVSQNITPEEERIPTENGKWTVGKLFEHMALAESSMIKICEKLLSGSRDNGLNSDGDFSISDTFRTGLEKMAAEESKFEAPEIVQPEGGKPIADSIKGLNSNTEKLGALKPMFEQYDGRAATFPHPAFGAMTAIDWLVLIGLHEKRHLDQVERILSGTHAANG